MISTIVGYAGGSTVNPSYHDLGDHTETVEIIYNPNIINYEELLNIFWNAHNPTYKPKKQYMSIIFYHDDTQKQEAIEIKKRFEWKVGQTLYTEITQFKNFYPAEKYHQKYYLQRIPELYKRLKSMYNDFDEFIFSTLAARVNGYAAGYIDVFSLKNELKHLEIPEDNCNKLMAVLEKL